MQVKGHTKVKVKLLYIYINVNVVCEGLAFAFDGLRIKKLIKFFSAIYTQEIDDDDGVSEVITAFSFCR